MKRLKQVLFEVFIRLMGVLFVAYLLFLAWVTCSEPGSSWECIAVLAFSISLAVGVVGLMLGKFRQE